MDCSSTAEEKGVRNKRYSGTVLSVSYRFSCTAVQKTMLQSYDDYLLPTCRGNIVLMKRHFKVSKICIWLVKSGDRSLSTFHLVAPQGLVWPGL